MKTRATEKRKDTEISFETALFPLRTYHKVTTGLYCLYLITWRLVFQHLLYVINFNKAIPQITARAILGGINKQKQQQKTTTKEKT